MGNEQDVRWLQRYENFKAALGRLRSVVASGRAISDLSDLEQSGLIQWFEFTYELAWKTMQDLLAYKGYDFVKGPNGTLTKALQDGLIDDQDGWRQMAKDRILMSHTYDETDAIKVVESIFTTYYWLLEDLNKSFCEQKKAMAL